MNEVIINNSYRGATFLIPKTQGTFPNLVNTSVARLLDYLFNICQFITMKMCLMAKIFSQSRIKILPNTKLNLK